MANQHFGQRGQFKVPEPKTMPNGEMRASMGFPDGTAFVRTWAAPEPVWQEAHYHKGLEELYLVHAGSIVIVTANVQLKDVSNICFKPLQHDSPAFLLPAGTHHNVLVGLGAIFDVVKRGKPVGNPNKNENDWWPSKPDFNTWTHGLSEHETLKRHGCIPA